MCNAPRARFDIDTQGAACLRDLIGAEASPVSLQVGYAVDGSARQFGLHAFLTEHPEQGCVPLVPMPLPSEASSPVTVVVENRPGELGEFERNLLLYAKRQYLYEGDRKWGVRVLVGAIAGIHPEEVRYRDVARWLVNVLIWIDRSSPTSIGGGMPRALTSVFDAMDPVRYAAFHEQTLDYWEGVVQALLGQVTITRVRHDETTLFCLPEPDPVVQMALDADASGTARAEESSCGNHIDVPTVFGHKRCYPTADQVRRLDVDPAAVHAELLGFLAADDYREWMDCEGAVRCNAHTASGKRCTNTVNGITALAPAEWLVARKERAYCVLHSK